MKPRTIVFALLGVLALFALSGVFMGRRALDTAPPPPSTTYPVPPSPSPGPGPSAVDALLSQLPWGHVAFDAPSTMRYEEANVFELVLSGSSSGEELKQQLASHASPSQAAEVDRVQFSGRMKAQLEGYGFQIKPLTPELQAVASRGATRWRWSVMPVEAGALTLDLSLSAPLKIDGDDAPYVQTFQRHIEVRVTAAQRVAAFVSSNWQWLWTAILVPLAPFAWARLRRLRKPPSDPAAAAPPLLRRLRKRRQRAA